MLAFTLVDLLAQEDEIEVNPTLFRYIKILSISVILKTGPSRLNIEVEIQKGVLNQQQQHWY